MKPHTVIPVFGEPIEILVPSETANYTVCVGVQTSPPGGGPPPHRHLCEEETFVVLEGDFNFFNGEGWQKMTKGEAYCSLRGNYHAFRNVGSTPGKMLFMTNGGGIDEYFQEISSLVLPKDMDRVNEISKYYNYEFKAPDSPSGAE